MPQNEKQHSLIFDNDVLTVKGVVQVVSISEKEAIFKLDGKTLTVRGSGLNLARLDKEQGVVVLEVKSLSGLTYRQGGMSFKGLFK